MQRELENVDIPIHIQPLASTTEWDLPRPAAPTSAMPKIQQDALIYLGEPVGILDGRPITRFENMLHTVHQKEALSPVKSRSLQFERVFGKDENLFSLFYWATDEQILEHGDHGYFTEESVDTLLGMLSAPAPDESQALQTQEQDVAVRVVILEESRTNEITKTAKVAKNGHIPFPPNGHEPHITIDTPPQGGIHPKPVNLFFVGESLFRPREARNASELAQVTKRLEALVPPNIMRNATERIVAVVAALADAHLTGKVLRRDELATMTGIDKWDINTVVRTASKYMPLGLGVKILTEAGRYEIANLYQHLKSNPIKEDEITESGMPRPQGSGITAEQRKKMDAGRRVAKATLPNGDVKNMPHRHADLVNVLTLAHMIDQTLDVNQLTALTGIPPRSITDIVAGAQKHIASGEIMIKQFTSRSDINRGIPARYGFTPL